MNYSSMIEEKHLKKGFIIATLISTVIGTFTTSIGLYERVRDRHMQHKTDNGQNEQIKDLQRRADEADRARRKAERDKDRSLSVGWRDADVHDELAASGPMIRREYDRNYARFGPRFAEGDQIAQNELQAQIIEMQASVIRLLQDALVSGTMPDPAALYAAAGRARNGSIRALSDQHQRLLAAAPISNGGMSMGRRALRSASVAASSTRSPYAEQRRADYGDDGDDSRRFRQDMDMDMDRDRDRKRRSMSQAMTGTRRASTFPVQLPPPPPAEAAAQPPLYCRYAIQLQKDWRRPLALGSSDDASTRSGPHDDDDGDLVCPACMGSFAIEHDRSWKMHKPVLVGAGVGGEARTIAETDGAGADLELVQDRLFVVSNRFIIKCHRPAAYDGLENALLPPTYACCLCDEFDADGKIAVCSTMARLVSHVCDKHSAAQLLSDPDIREIRRGGDRR